MPKGDNPKSRANLKKGAATRFNGETAAEAGRKGAAVSNRVQKERKTFRELLEILMTMPAIDNDTMKAECDPVTGEPLNNAQSITLALARKARQGDVQAIKQLAELIGEAESKAVVENNITINVSES